MDRAPSRLPTLGLRTVDLIIRFTISVPTREARRARRLVRVSLFWGAAGLLTTAVLSMTFVNIANRSLGELRAQHTRIDQLEELRAHILVSRAEHRAFLLTGSEVARGRYVEAEGAARRLLTSLDALTATDSASRALLQNISTSFDSSSQARSRSAKARAAGIVDAALLFSDSTSSRYRTALDASVRTAYEHESNGLAIVRARWERASAWELRAIYGTLALLAVGVASLLVTLRREAVQTALSEARYRALTDDSPDGILVQIGGVVGYANSAATALMRIPENESLVGRSFFDLVHPDDRALARERARAVVERGEHPEPRAIRFRRADGTDLDAEVRGTRVVFDGQPAGQVVLRDLHDRQEAQRALAASEHRYRALLQDMDEGVILADTNLTIQLWNPAAERILGLTGDQLAGRSSHDPRWRIVGIDGAPMESHQRIAATALRTGEKSSGEMGVERPDGSRVWIKVSAIPLRREASADPYAVEITFADVTSEREATRRIQESEARYRLLADNIADLVSRRTLDHRFEYVSPSHELVLGWTSDDLIGRSAFDYLHPDDRERVRPALATLGSGSTSPQLVLRVRHKQGHYVWLESIAKPIHNETGEMIAYQISARDVSARHALEEQLRQSQKMEAMGRMASGIAHDFNNLLTVMRASAEVLEDAALTELDRREVQREMQHAIERASALTSQLLTFSRGRPSEPEQLRLASLVQNAIPLLARLAGAGVEVDVIVDVDAQSALIDAESVQVEQVLFNLVANARDAMAAGGQVRVSCGVTQFAEALPHAHGVIEPGRYVTLCVKDSGSGMDDAVLARLFEPFFTTKPVGVGTGLGLSTVFGIVKQARGAIAVESKLGAGTAVTVYWPRVQVKPLDRRFATAIANAEARRSGPHASVVDSQAQRVLVVDDEPVVGAMIGRLLGRIGYTVEVETSANEALNMLRADASAYQLLITDVRMPHLSGIEFVRRLVEGNIEVPVLFVSGQIDEPFPTDWPTRMAYSFLGKPFTIDELAREVRNLTKPRQTVA